MNGISLLFGSVSDNSWELRHENQLFFLLLLNCNYFSIVTESGVIDYYLIYIRLQFVVKKSYIISFYGLVVLLINYKARMYVSDIVSVIQWC